MITHVFVNFMLNKLTIILAALLSVTQVLAQDIRVSVHLGDEAAEYAFVTCNSAYVGTCDSPGRLSIGDGILFDGDTLRAGMAGLESGSVLYRPGHTRYGLLIPARVLAGAVVSESEVPIMEEYFKRISKFKFKKVYYGDKYRMSYRRTERMGELPGTDHTGSTVLALLHPQDDPRDVYWYKFREADDSTETAWGAFALHYSNQMLLQLLSKK